MKHLLAIAFSGALLGACVASPSTAPQEVALQAGALGLGATPAPAVADKWWVAFGDPQLDGLVDQALTGNPSLAVALARMRLAQSELSASRAATYPQVTLDGEEQRARLSKAYIIPPPFAGSTQWVGMVQGNLAWSLDFFGKEQGQVDKARATTAAAALNVEAGRLALAGTITQAYVALARAYDLVDVAEEAVKQRQGILTLTAGRVRSGLDNETSERMAEALLSGAREDLIRAKANCDLAVHQIAALAGRGPDAYSVSRPHLKTAALPLPDSLPADLLARRADIAAALAQVSVGVSGREIARKAFYPDINLLGVAGWSALGLGAMFTGSALQYGVAPAIHLPIFDAGELRANYAGATANLDQSVAAYNEIVIAAVKQTADAITELRTLRDQVVEHRLASAAAEAAFHLAEQRYNSGLSPQLNVLSAEDLLIQVRRQDAALSADTTSAMVTLLMAAGGGFEPSKNDLSGVSLSHQEHTHD